MKKLECPHCGFIKVLGGRELRTFRKRLSGFTCTKCKKKVSPHDLAKKRGKGPKPKDERRKRVKKDVKETPIIVAPQPAVEQIVWRTGGPPPPGENLRHPVRAGWQPRQPKPTERTLGEAVMVYRGIKPSAPLPDSNPYSNLEMNEELEKLKEERQALEGIRESLEKNEKRLAVRIHNLGIVEKRMEEKVKELDIRLAELDSKLHVLSTLTSHMEMILDVAERKRVLVR